jgi:hypothetical protein
MAVTHLKTKLDPEKLPDFLKGKFFELYEPKKVTVPKEDSYAPWGFEYDYNQYVGWLSISEDGTIEIGEPGE